MVARFKLNLWNLNRRYEYKNVDSGSNKFEKHQYLQKRCKTIQTEKWRFSRYRVRKYQEKFLTSWKQLHHVKVDRLTEMYFLVLLSYLFRFSFQRYQTLFEWISTLNHTNEFLVSSQRVELFSRRFFRNFKQKIRKKCTPGGSLNFLTRCLRGALICSFFTYESSLFAIFTRKHLCWSLFSIRSAIFLKRDSNRGVFLWIL